MVWIWPAACQLEPDVSSSRSSSTTSFQPNFARWNRIEQPTTPPPMMTTLAWDGSFFAPGLSSFWISGMDRRLLMGAAAPPALAERALF